MLKKITIFMVMVSFMLCSFSVMAEYKKVKAVGSYKCSFAKHVSSSKKRKALEDAKYKSLDKYLAGLDSQRVRILNNVKDDSPAAS